MTDATLRTDFSPDEFSAFAEAMAILERKLGARAAIIVAIDLATGDPVVFTPSIADTASATEPPDIRKTCNQLRYAAAFLDPEGEKPDA